ncbi:hypothetical protein V496_09469, partial [Pseudogymnoascus sp. VKM F-4515 (FW-2607)]
AVFGFGLDFGFGDVVVDSVGLSPARKCCDTQSHIRYNPTEQALSLGITKY